jgi:branched-chain amino acid transport system substrate-binding protein/urea transport system substrate-binding protein
LRKIEASGATILVNTVVGADAVTFMKQFTAAGLKDKATFAWFGFSENYLPALTPEESEGILTVVNFVGTLDRSESKAFVAKVKQAYGEDAIVSGTVDAHYMITKFFINGVQRAQSDDKEKIIDAMVDQRLMSANGEVRLRASDRHTDLNVVIAGVEDGQLLSKVYVGRVDAANQCG